MFFFLVKILLFLLMVVFVLGAVRTWHVQHDVRQKKFIQGTVPPQLPDGMYQGSVGRSVTWKGKKFNAAEKTGINVFATEAGLEENYPFVMSKGKGIIETTVAVIKIDYNTPHNPLWLRPVLDEIVETSPGVYLGKMYFRIPWITFSLGYFQLHK